MVKVKSHEGFSKTDGQAVRIMVVDDESDITLSYKLVLESAGFIVDVYNDPLVALSKIKEVLLPAKTAGKEFIKPYDLLLLDIKMPKMNGFELYREARKIIESQGANTKVCFVTAYEPYYENIKEEFPMIDVGCFIKKPVRSNDLVERVKKELY